MHSVRSKPRYLTSFTPKLVTHFFTDILIVGGGVAGLRAALEVDASLNVLVVTKDALRESNSNYAQGGIAGVLDPEDKVTDHVRDTVIAGGGLCNMDVVEMVISEAPDRILELVEWGMNFDRIGEKLALTREGGHSFARIVHALGDSTGRELMRAIIHKTRAAEHVTIWEQSYTIDLLTTNDDCHGALIWHPNRGFTCVWSKQTILATGGAGQLFRETTNPNIATGDGIATGFRAGAVLRDMEFMQFHPTVLYIAGSSRHLITEAVRGEGAFLRDCDGVRFMPEKDPRAELAPRDIVSQCIVERMAATQHPNVYLDLTHLDDSFTRKRFPGIARICGSFGLDITTDLIPVRPGAHYMIGGLEVDLDGRTTIERLWACGEVTSTGLHGANRLASNSLLEGLVYGVRCGAGAAREAARMSDSFHALPIENGPRNVTAEEFNLQDLRNSLSSLMWRSVGIEREGESLKKAAGTVDFWSRYALESIFKDPIGWELQNMLCIGAITIAAASARLESRGVHLRKDFPQTDDSHWQRHLPFKREDPSQKNESPG